MNDTNLLENHSQQVLNHLTRSLSDSDLYRFETTNSLPTMNSKSPSVISWPIVNDIEEWFNFNPPSYDHIFFDPIRSTQIDHCLNRSLLIEDLKRLIRQQQEQSSTKIKEMTVKNFELEKKLEDLIERNALSIKEINLIHEELEHIKSISREKRDKTSEENDHLKRFYSFSSSSSNKNDFNPDHSQPNRLIDDCHQSIQRIENRLEYHCRKNFDLEMKLQQWNDSLRSHQFSLKSFESRLDSFEQLLQSILIRIARIETNPIGSRSRRKFQKNSSGKTLMNWDRFDSFRKFDFRDDKTIEDPIPTAPIAYVQPNVHAEKQADKSSMSIAEDTPARLPATIPNETNSCRQHRHHHHHHHHHRIRLLPSHRRHHHHHH
ncbi:hypothetical protein SSS_02164 [Sarcoptes scabiei]|uniref:Uncharacterized protein n=1 Tax=Sarcoptes scabiei TaxID=52283 RepID=A0A834R8A7_SARSC|nr:hypothetical protein SSS_02164 [Sarcoptes scabiei]